MFICKTCPAAGFQKEEKKNGKYVANNNKTVKFIYYYWYFETDDNNKNKRIITINKKYILHSDLEGIFVIKLNFSKKSYVGRFYTKKFI